MPYCPNCQSFIPDGVNFCSSCGRQVVSTTQQTAQSAIDYFNQGNIYAKAKDFKAANDCYDKGLQLDQNNYKIWHNKGFVLKKLGDFEGAEYCSKRENELKDDSYKLLDPDENDPGKFVPLLSTNSPVPLANGLSKNRRDINPYYDNLLLIGLFITGVCCIFIPLIGIFFVIPIIIASAYFAYKDAQDIGAGQAPGSWSPLTIGLLVLLFWLFALPIYILKRRSIYEACLKAPQGPGVPAPSQTNGLVIVLILLGGIILFIIAGAVIAAFVFGVASTGPSSEALTYDSDYSTSIATAYSTPRATVKATPKAVNTLQWGDLEVQPDWGWTTEGYGIRYITGTVRNLGPRTYIYAQIMINTYDDSGAQIGSALDNINNLEPYGTWKFKALVFEDSATQAKIKEITAF